MHKPYYSGVRGEISFVLQGKLTYARYKKIAKQAFQALRLLFSNYVMWQQVNCIRLFACFSVSL